MTTKGQEILDKFKEGKLPKEMIELGYNKTTVYKYWKIFDEYKTLNQKLWNIIYETA